MQEKAPEHVVLSRTDSIGDVLLTLPMAGLLRERWPGIRITFIGRGYTAPLLRCCTHVDHVLTLEELEQGDARGTLRDLHADVLVHVFPRRSVAGWAKAAGIPLRIGTSHRWWHWTTCNARVAFSRKRSELHEAQLNVKLLQPLGFTETPGTAHLGLLSGLLPPVSSPQVRALLGVHTKRRVVLHPLSKGSAVEWGLDHFAALIRMLDPERYHVIVTGTQAEAERYRPKLPLDLPHVSDAGGLLPLDQLIALIAGCDALVAASTGPLHIAAACGLRAIGLYSPKRPIHPGRWAPIGRDAHALVAQGQDPNGDPAEHIRAIDPRQVAALLEQAQ